MDKDVVYPGDVINATILINTTNPFYTYIDLYALGHESWFTWNRTPFYVYANKIIKKNLTIKIPLGVKGGRYYYYVYLKNPGNESIVTKVKKAIFIQDQPQVSIDATGVRYSTIIPGKKEIIYVYVKNEGKIDAKNYRVIIRVPDLGYYKEFPININAGDSTVVRGEVEINKDELPKDIKVFVELYNERNKKIAESKTSFKIGEFKSIEEKINVVSNLFKKEIYVSYKNTGNVRDVAKYVLKKTHLLWIYDFKGKKPQKEEEGYVIVCDLDPKESCSFSIVINYWILYLVLLIILTLLILLFISFISPRVVKQYYRRGQRYLITIKVINHKQKEMKEAVLKEYVKGIFNIIEQSIIPKPSKIHKTKSGYVIEWKLGNLKPGEIRMFKYEVQPKINVEGDIKMDKCVLEGTMPNGKRKKFSC